MQLNRQASTAIQASESAKVRPLLLHLINQVAKRMGDCLWKDLEHQAANYQQWTTMP
jgi:hypothetical protein